MKKLLFSIFILAALPLASLAQNVQQPLTAHQQPLPVQQAKPVKFGYFSYDKVLKSMPGYAIVRHNNEELRNQYTAEAKRSEDDFNTKYEAFLDEQAGLATNIRKKRQAELMDLMQKNVEFKKSAEKLIAESERTATDSLCHLIDAAAHTIGAERGLAFVLNTDKHALPFVNPQYCEDITVAIEEKLK